MSGAHLRGQRGVRRDELGAADERDLDAAVEVSLLLDASMDPGPTGAAEVPPGFARSVMTVIANEPTPGTFGFMLPLRRRGLLGGFGASVRHALAAIGPGRPSFARATALGYVLAVAIAGIAVAGGATVGVGNALGLFHGPTPSEMPEPTRAPSPAVTPAPGPTTSPSMTPTPSTSTEPAASPEASDDHGGSASAEPSDDHGGDSGPGSSSGSDDHSGSSGSDGSGSSGSSDDTSTPRPTDTPEPTDTPKPSATPH